MVNFYTDTENKTHYDIEYLQSFIEEIAKNSAGRNLNDLTGQQRAAIESMPFQLAKYLLEVGKLKKELEKEEINAEITAKKKEAEERLKEIIVDVFTKSCASEIDIEHVVNFKHNFALDGKDLNDFKGNPPMNPLTAGLAGNRSAEDLDKLTKEGCNLHFKDKDGNNFAHYGAKYGVDDEVMKYAIDNGVDINARNDFGQTPLDVAKMNGHKGLSEFLAKNNAKAGVTADRGESRQRELDEKMRKKAVMVARVKKPAAAIHQAQSEFIDYDVMDDEKEDKGSENWFGFGNNKENKLYQDVDRKELERQEKILEEKKIEIAPKKLEVVEKVLKNYEKEIEEKPNVVLQAVAKHLGFEVDNLDINQLLILAVKSSCNMLATLLVNSGADVNHQSEGKTIFELAYERGMSSSLLHNMAGRATGKTIEAAVNAALKQGKTVESMLKTDKGLSDEISAHAAPSGSVKDIIAKQLFVGARTVETN